MEGSVYHKQEFTPKGAGTTAWDQIKFAIVLSKSAVRRCFERCGSVLADHDHVDLHRR